MSVKSLIKLFFIAAAFLHLYMATRTAPSFLNVSSKLLLMPLLIILSIHYRSRSENKDLWNILILALFFSFLGDLFLSDLFDRNLSFIYGLGSFLITHLLYIMVFKKAGSNGRALRTRRLILPAVLIITWMIVIFSLIEESLGGLLVPVSAYMIVITVMCLSALSRYGNVPMISFYGVFSGTILFMISDMIIALNRFHGAVDHERLLVMFSYILAQYLIVEGLMRGDKLQEETK